MTRAAPSGAPGASPRPAARYLLAALVDAVGSGLFLPASIIIFTRYDGLPAVDAAGALSVAAVAGLLATPFGGIAVDRWGGKRSAVVLYLFRGVGYGGYALVHSTWQLGLAAAVARAAGQMIDPALVEITTALSDQGPQQVSLLAYASRVRNLGMGVGFLLTSALLTGPGHTMLLLVIAGQAASFWIAALVLTQLRTAGRHGDPGQVRPSYRDVLRDRHFIAVTALYTVLISQTEVLVLGVPLWIVGHTSLPAWTVGATFVINTVLVLLFQSRISAGASDMHQAGRLVRAAGAALAAACLLYASTAVSHRPAAQLAIAAAAIVAFTLGELATSAGSWGLSLGFSAGQARGRYLAVFTVADSLSQVVAPVIVVGALTILSGWSWVLFAAAFFASGLAMLEVVRRAIAQVPAGPPAS